MKRNTYHILGLKHDATDSQIREAFRRLAKQYHPDHNVDDPLASQRFAEVKQAYEILGSRQSRAEFDFAAERQSSGSGKKRKDTHQYNPFSRDFQKEEPRTAGKAINSQKVALSLEEIVGAQSIKVRFSGGREISLAPPEEVIDGQTLRLKNNSTDSEDYLVILEIKPHKLYQREGFDLHMKLAVSLEDAVLGERVKISTLHGVVEMKLIAGKGVHSVMRIAGKGLPHKNGVGDLLVHPFIQLPQEMDKELLALMRKQKLAQNPHLKTDFYA